MQLKIDRHFRALLIVLAVLMPIIEINQLVR